MGGLTNRVLPRLRIIQVGDIHLPSALLTQGIIDDKDPKFPGSLKDRITAQPLKTVFKKIYERVSQQHVDCVLFMGDLTDIGKLDGYADCCQYIAKGLQLGAKGALARVKVGVVPGNHDVNRSLAKAPGGAAKFKPLNDALAAEGLPALPVETTIKIPLVSGQLSANVYLLNSCWGCGEVENIPEAFRTPIAEAIEKTLAGPKREEAIKLYYDRQLDTPAISMDCLDEVVNAINATPTSAVPVIVAHHNLLPQRTPRLAPYTELVNAGALRNSLQDLARPVLYLHGHIHDEPIEIVQPPRGAPLIVISAPEISSGFNVIDIVFTTDGLPLACHVEPWRFDKSGVFRANPVARNCLLTKRRRASNPQLARLYAKMLERRECYWTEVVQISGEIDSSATDEGIIEQLELLLADDCIYIENYEMLHTHWIMRAEM